MPAGAFIAINLSPETLASDAMVETLRQFPLDRLVIELTEHEPVMDYAAVHGTLGPLRERGLRLAVDDAGAGFASLRHILRLAPDIIKLDRSLTAGIHLDQKRRALAAALISFAEETEASLIAEGIETQVQLDVLRSLGVPCGQGYYLGRPGRLPCSEEIEVLVATANRPAGRPPTTRLRQMTDLVKLLEAALAASETSTPEQALKLALDRICDHTGWPVGHALLMNREATALVSARIWHLGTTEHFDQFLFQSESRSFPRGEGLPGMALELGEPVWMSDITGAPQCRRSREAAKAGMRAAFAVPIIVEKQVFGVLEFFSLEALVPDDPLLEILSRFGGQLGRVLQRKRMEAQLLKQRIQLLRTQRLAGIGSWEWDAQQNTVTCSEELCRILAVDAPSAEFEDLLALMHPQDRGHVARCADLCVETATAVDFECRIIRPDGQRVLRGGMEPVIDMRGGLLGIVGTVQDVTPGTGVGPTPDRP
jgi:GAF domain-containing protein